MKKIFLMALSIFCTYGHAQNIELLADKNFNQIIDQQQVCLYTLTNSNGCTAQFTNYGARWLSFWCKDRNGNWGDVVLGFDSLKGYQTAAEGYHGATVGRICGRINQGKFTMDGKKYKLANNDGFGYPLRSHLHGGIKGFHKQMWKGKQGIDSLNNQYVEFSYLSIDGEEGFPGNLDVTIRYTMKEDNTLRIEYWATTDKRTLVNLTNHAFFNMSGNPSTTVNNQILSLNCDKYIQCDKQLVPTGKIINVKGTPLDYTEPIRVAQNFSKNHPEIIKDKGIAIAYVLKPSSSTAHFLNYAAKLQDPISGRAMTVYTNQPSLQVYNAWLMDGTDLGKANIPYHSSAGIVLESQGFPDAPNHSNFPSVILDKGQVYNHIVEYKFSVE